MRENFNKIKRFLKILNFSKKEKSIYMLLLFSKLIFCSSPKTSLLLKIITVCLSIFKKKKISYILIDSPQQTKKIKPINIPEKIVLNLVLYVCVCVCVFSLSNFSTIFGSF